MCTGCCLDLSVRHHVDEVMSSAGPLRSIAVIPSAIEVAETPYVYLVGTGSPYLAVRDACAVAESLTSCPLTVTR